MKQKVALIVSVVMILSMFLSNQLTYAADPAKAEITLKIFAYDPDKKTVDFTADKTEETLIVGDVVAVVPVLTNLSAIAENGVFEFCYAFHYDTGYMKQLLFEPEQMIDENAASNPIIGQGLSSLVKTNYDVQVSTFEEPNPNVEKPSETQKLFQMIFLYAGNADASGILTQADEDLTVNGVKLGVYPFEVVDQPDGGALQIGVQEDEKYLSGQKLQSAGSLQKLETFVPEDIVVTPSQPSVKRRSRQPEVIDHKILDVDLTTYLDGSKITITKFADGTPITAATSAAMYEQKNGAAVQTVSAVAASEEEGGGFKIEFPLTTGATDKTYYFAALETSDYAWSNKTVLLAKNLTKPNVQEIMNDTAAAAISDTDLSTDMTASERAAIHNSGLPASMEVMEGTTKTELMDKYQLNEKVTVKLSDFSLYYDPNSKYTAIPVVWDVADNFTVTDDGTHQMTLTGKFDAATLESQGISTDGVVTTETATGEIQPTDLKPVIVLDVISKSRMPLVNDRRDVDAATGEHAGGYSRATIEKFIDDAVITATTKAYLYSTLTETVPDGTYTAAMNPNGTGYTITIPFPDGQKDQTWYIAVVEGDSYIESDRAILLKTDLIASQTVEVQKAMSKTEVEGVTDTVLAGMPESELKQFRNYGLPGAIYVHEGTTGAELLADYALQQRASVQLKKDTPYYDPTAKYSVLGVNWQKPKEKPEDADTPLDSSYTVAFGDSKEITLSGTFNDNELTAKSLKLAEDTQMPTVKLKKIQKSELPKLEATKNLDGGNYGIGANVTIKELVDGTKFGADAVVYVYDSASSTAPVATVTAEADGAGGYKVVYSLSGADRNLYFSIDPGSQFDESDKAVLLADENLNTAPNIQKILSDDEMQAITDDDLPGMVQAGTVDTFRKSVLPAEVNILEGSSLDTVKDTVQNAVSVQLTAASQYYDPNSPYAFIKVDWNLNGYDPTMKAGTKVDVTGVFNQNAMKNMGVVPVVAPAADPVPAVKLNIVKSLTGEVTVTLEKGNAREAVERDLFDENDIIIFYQKKFKDFGFTATDASGNDVSDQITRSITVKKWKDSAVTAGKRHAFPIKEGDETFEEVTFTKAAGSAVDITWEEFTQNIVAGTYTLEYRLNDEVLKTRNIHIRYPRGDTMLDGKVDISDITPLAQNTLNLENPTLKDEYYFDGYRRYVADTTKDIEGGREFKVDISDVTPLAQQVLNWDYKQDYDCLFPDESVNPAG